MEPEEKANGALIGSVIIILILILGGIYFWKTSVKKVTQPPVGVNTPLSGSRPM